MTKRKAYDLGAEFKLTSLIWSILFFVIMVFAYEVTSFLFTCMTWVDRHHRPRNRDHVCDKPRVHSNSSYSLRWCYCTCITAMSNIEKQRNLTMLRKLLIAIRSPTKRLNAVYTPRQRIRAVAVAVLAIAIFCWLYGAQTTVRGAMQRRW